MVGGEGDDAISGGFVEFDDDGLAVHEAWGHGVAGDFYGDDAFWIDGFAHLDQVRVVGGALPFAAGYLAPVGDEIDEGRIW